MPEAYCQKFQTSKKTESQTQQNLLKSGKPYLITSALQRKLMVLVGIDSWCYWKNLRVASLQKFTLIWMSRRWTPFTKQQLKRMMILSCIRRHLQGPVLSLLISLRICQEKRVFHQMWLDFGKLPKLSHQANSILLAQLIATLIHHPYTVVLPGLADWFAFLEQVCQPCKVTTETTGPMKGITWMSWVWNWPQC